MALVASGGCWLVCLGVTVSQAKPGGTTAGACAMCGSLMAVAQSRWPSLSLELCAQLQVVRRRRKWLGRNPADGWVDHTRAVRAAYTAEAEEKHIRRVADLA